ncbi:Lipid A 3-O-deacylase-related protein [Marinomonas mediterranea MMB-1]|uniref:Lipid A 3-O-deacylase-related protein n=2 Tax=Marinomonas mediterranea TaxID=119864 RepID=F2JWK7_MARM1|nr:Lipid A 3-O-deacylase-related protein [Marinomonas mediterranea MMB-1]
MYPKMKQLNLLERSFKLTKIGLFFAITSSVTTQVMANETALWRSGMIAATTAAYLTNALNADTMLVESGTSGDVLFLRYSARWYAEKSTYLSDDFQITPSLQIGYSKWQDGFSLSHADTSNVVDLLPVFRWSGDDLPIFDFIDTGIGLSIMSNENISDKEMGGPLQFNNYLGAGWQLGKKDQWEISLHFQHYSNNDIYDENSGINFTHLSIGYNY